ncbi:MAG: sigma-70 family RNA polymerase sigma factor, partial [Anaerolineales bacterium]
QLRQALVESRRGLISLDSANEDDPEASSLHEVLVDHVHAENADPSEALAERDLHRQLVSALTALPERERTVLALYYNEELTLKEIGAALHLSESRVCQLHAQAVMNLRALLEGDCELAGFVEGG